ncbi:MAG: M15 family metallopeptidase [Candidatus Adiutrix sp.]|jgi:peptidoglycan L-alanyl-D-glutamate endopeptidase CwlK|nr:M15 family metallopeptidase [Candidatus Adiutrix sp.]
MGFKLSLSSRGRLADVHPDLTRVVERAIEITDVDFRVAEGLRSLERQKLNVKNGVSKTLHSKHLRQPDGYAHAVDLYPLDADGKLVLDWGSPWPGRPWAGVNWAMKTAARELDIAIVWVGDWPKFRDGPHYELA